MALRWAGARLGLTYEAINIYLFVILWPLLSVASLIGHWWQWRRHRQLRRRLDGLRG
jgi:DNA-binding transcriptional regulator of glucitol operon